MDHPSDVRCLFLRQRTEVRDDSISVDIKGLRSNLDSVQVGISRQPSMHRLQEIFRASFDPRFKMVIQELKIPGDTRRWNLQDQVNTCRDSSSVIALQDRDYYQEITTQHGISRGKTLHGLE